MDVLYEFIGWHAFVNARNLSWTMKQQITPLIHLHMQVHRWWWDKCNSRRSGNCIDMYEARDEKWTVTELLRERYEFEREGSVIMAEAVDYLPERGFRRFRAFILRCITFERTKDAIQYNDGWDAFFTFDEEILEDSDDEMPPSDEKLRRVWKVKKGEEESEGEEDRSWADALEYQELTNKLSCFTYEARNWWPIHYGPRFGSATPSKGRTLPRASRSGPRPRTADGLVQGVPCRAEALTGA